MSKFLIESPHTKAECLQVLDETVSKGEDVLKKFEWGCGSGNHTAWAFVDADSESKAKNIVPSMVRGKAYVTKVSKVTPKQIRDYHNM